MHQAGNRAEVFLVERVVQAGGVVEFLQVGNGLFPERRADPADQVEVVPAHPQGIDGMHGAERLNRQVKLFGQLFRGMDKGGTEGGMKP